METKKRSILKLDIPKSDIGILISDLFKLLISTDQTANQIKEILNEQFEQDEFIPIPGAQTLVNSQIVQNKNYIKKDLISTLDNITFYSDNTFTINFNNINDQENFGGKTTLNTYPKYSAQRDFFGNLFSMDKYAKKLIDNGFKKIVETNLELLKEEKIKDKKYRLIHYKPDNNYYLRAIVSTDNYFDYNNSIAVVIALLTLYKEIKSSGVAYSLKLCEYNESNIRMFFDSTGEKELEGIGYVKNIVEISNDEIKREALRFSGVCTISYDTQKKINEIYIKPKDIKSKILTIKHNQKPQNGLKSLTDFENVDKVHNELYEDIKAIKNIKNTEQIKFLVRRKIDNAKNEDIRKFKASIMNELTATTTKNIIDLLNLFNNIQILANEDIEASEYLRYVIYEALINRK
ncbi:hypothetical protein SAMN05421846_10229 [Chryseobacterium taeanense]|uniref:Uncharacterized protein n=2 Tax=Chryseobacterium group TaxID=2782232 RepID=A0A1G8F7Q1_9FLAO|nr:MULTISPECIES: hypothetical protein [Chryseobacterium group]SDH78039.1 hypothetical protein SAMN05421846_10229 [Chryseobacterium taeanense]SMP85894.1 hypothetical protein SAMN05421679_10135 [Epilithonimonas pallida]